MSKPKLLITGGAGYIGSHTNVALVEPGYDLVIVDNYNNSSPEAVRRTGELTGTELKVYECDINDEAALDAVFAAEPNIEGVIHFAAYKAVGDSVKDPLNYYSNNIGGSLSLFRVMQKHDVKKIVFSSSATVYGVADISEMPLKESASIGATNPYGRTKEMMERILMDTAEAFGWDAVILRYFNPVGAHPSGTIGEAPDYPTNLLPFVCEVAVGKRKEVVVFGDDWPTPDGTGVRDYIHVWDLAKAHVAAMDAACDACGVKVYNVGSGNGSSVLELIGAFDRTCGFEVPRRIGPRRDGDVAVSVANPAKINEELGWKTELDLDAMVADAWRWQQQNPKGYA